MAGTGFDGDRLTTPAEFGTVGAGGAVGTLGRSGLGK